MKTQLATTMSVLLMSAALTAGGQNALGDGQALDANPSVQGARNVPIGRGVGANEYELRNLIITGNVAAGRGFRGSVGYTAPSDFRGATGSDDLFRLRARSALSQLAYITSAAPQRTLDLGQGLSMVEFRRTTTGADLNNVLRSRGAYGLYTDVESRLDQLSLIRTSGAEELDPSHSGELLAVAPDPQGTRVRIRASEARGVQMIREQTDVFNLGLTLYDQARVFEDQISGLEAPPPGTPYAALEQQRLQQPRQEQEQGADQRMDQERIGVFSEDYESLLTRLEERIGVSDTAREEDATGEPPRPGQTRQVGLAERMQEELARTRTFLAGDLEELEEAEPGETTEIVSPEDRRIPGLPDVPEGLPTVPTDRRQADQIDVSILRHGSEIERLTPESESRFAEILASGEDQLRKRNYFLAERNFLRALRFHPENPLAMAGLANAELGAGLHAAAAISLRNLFTKHPQMIDVRYGPEILPSRERLNELVEILTHRLEENPQLRSGVGLLISYIGHQTEDVDRTRRGLDLMEEADENDPLTVLLRGVWLDQDVHQRIEELRDIEVGDEADENAAAEDQTGSDINK